MIDLYRNEVREVPGTFDVFRRLHDRGVTVATDTSPPVGNTVPGHPPSAR